MSIDPDLILIAKIATPSVVLLVFLLRILIPWSNWLLAKKSNNGLKEEVEEIKNNDLHHCRTNREEFLEFQKEVRESFGKVHKRIDDLAADLNYLKGRINGKST